MIIIVGLGNPGEKYRNTRHNIGFGVIDNLSQKISCEMKLCLKFNCEKGECEINGKKVLLIKPQTYMNLSGICLEKLKNFYKIPNENILVVYDDIDLSLGKIRLRKNGGPGTHNGMKSITEKIGKNFCRLRLGIENRNIEDNQINTADYVLMKFTQEESTKVDKTSEKAVKTIIDILEKGMDYAMNKANQ